MKGTVIIISMVHWHFTWQIQQNIAKGLAERGYRVLFVEPLPKRWPRIDEFGRVWGRLTGHSEGAGICRQPLTPGVTLVSPRLLPDTGPISQALNRRTFVPSIASSLAESAERPLIVINYLPTATSLALMHALKPDATFYHCVNDWSNDPYTPAHSIEATLAASVDMVWADSPVNVTRTKTMSDNVVEMAGGVDVSIFAAARKSPGLPPERPLCAYFGTISLSNDIELLRAVSHRYPLRLIGPVRENLDGFGPETEIVGAVPQSQVPALIHDVDVLLLPYAPSTHNKSVMPAKLFECLATGKPIVVSGLHAVDAYADLLYIRHDQTDFLETIGASVHESPHLRQARIACAEENSYERLYETVESYIVQTLQSRGRTEQPATQPDMITLELSD